MNNLSTSTKIAVNLLLLFSITHLALSGFSVATLQNGGGEFGALESFATGLFATITGLSSIALLIVSVFLKKQKRWAYILSLVLIILLLPILTFSDLTGIGFTMIPGSSISLIKEILPLATIFFLILGRKDFKKPSLS